SDDDGLIDGSGAVSYQMDSIHGPVTLLSSQGKTYNDTSSSNWNVIASAVIDTGFDLLLKGAKAKTGQFKVWEANHQGIITKVGKWLDSNQLVTKGYENTFATDFNNNGLIEGGSHYQMDSSAGPVSLIGSNGQTYTDTTNKHWDVIAAAVVEDGFDVLLEGANKKADRFKVWQSDFDGVITGRSDWIDSSQMSARGYEQIFGVDFNDDDTLTGQLFDPIG
ncbi:MAG: hypothetical protein AB8B36_14235, partial [Prochlorococcus sp.]